MAQPKTKSKDIRYLIDACFLTALIRSRDKHHRSATKFYEQHPDATLIAPTLAYFEFQAAQSRAGQKFRDVYVSNLKVFEVNMVFARRCKKWGLFELFPKLRGADLVYACIAWVHDIPLVTFDTDFDVYSGQIEVVRLV